MTAIRKSVVFAPENGFATGEPDTSQTNPSRPYCQFPPGTFISHTGARQATSVYTTGSKRRAGTVYGNFSGTWNISFPFDYNYLEPLTMVFESVTTEYSNGGRFDPIYGESGLANIKPSGTRLHYFSKINNARVKSFVIREKILNVMAGGSDGSDEVTILKGCVAKSINVTRSASGSQMNIEMSGVYADQETKLGSLQTTDYDMSTSMDGISQYSCMFVDGIQDYDYVGDVDSHSFSIDNNASLVFNTCTPIAKQYYEGQTNYSWNAQTYSNDPTKKFQLRPNSGGKYIDIDGEGNKTLAMQPLGKGMGPMTYATWMTYSASRRDSIPAGITPSSTYIEAVQESDCSFVACANNSTVKSMTWQKGDGSKMMDSLSSVECDEIMLRIVNGKESIWVNEHLIASPDPVTV